MNPDVQTYFERISWAVESILGAGEGLDGELLNQQPVPGESSSIYVLTTHIMGNLRQGILATLGDAEDNRNRDAEFVARGGSMATLHEEWSALQSDLEAMLAKLTPDDLERQYEHPRRGKMNGWAVLLNTAMHAAEHAGHAELTRQVLVSAHSGARGGIEQLGDG